MKSVLIDEEVLSALEVIDTNHRGKPRGVILFHDDSGWFEVKNPGLLFYKLLFLDVAIPLKQQLEKDREFEVWLRKNRTEFFL